MTKHRVYLTVGFPGCGKSYWAKDKQKHQGAIRLSTDDYIEEWAKQQNTTYDILFPRMIGRATALFMSQVKKMSETFSYMEKRKRDVVIDRTNLNVESRAKILDHFDPEKWDRVAVVFRIPIGISKLRCTHNVPDEAYESMAERYQEPTLEEGFNKIIYVRQP